MSNVHRVRGAPGAAAPGRQARQGLRPRVVHRARPHRREDHRAVDGDRQGGLPRRQHPRGVRRRGRRHRRRRRGLRGARGAGLPAADDGRQPGDLRHRHRPLRHRGAEAALAARHLRRHRARWPSRSPSPTPAPTPTTSPPPPAATATSGCSRARRSTSPASTRPTTSWSSPAPRTPATGKLKPCLFVVPTDAAGFEFTAIPMEIVSPEKQFQVFIDDVRLPADALVGDEDGGLVQLFAGLNPERIMAASFSTGLARHALEKASAYAKERTVFKAPDRLAPGDRPPARDGPHRDRAGPADDPEGGRARRRRRRHGGRRGRQHGEVRRRRGRRARRRRARCRPTAATASRRSTAWPGCSSPPAPAGSRR